MNTILSIIACMILFPRFRAESVNSYFTTMLILLTICHTLKIKSEFISLSTVFFFLDTMLFIFNTLYLLQNVKIQSTKDFFNCITYFLKQPYILMQPKFVLTKEHQTKQDRIIRQANRKEFTVIETIK